MSRPGLHEPGERRALLETRLYTLTPVAPLILTLLIASAVFAGFVALSVVHGAPVLTGTDLTSEAQLALIVSLLLAAAIDLPERTRRIWQAEAHALKACVSARGAALVDGLCLGQPRAITLRVWLWFAAGALCGLGFLAAGILGDGGRLADYMASPGAWLMIVIPVLFGLGGRAIRLMSEDDRTIASLVNEHVEIDFADLDRLQVYGRIGLRTALIWLVMAGLILAFLAVQSALIASGLAFTLALAAALWSMLSVTRPVAKKVDAAKTAALLETRRRLVEASDEARIGSGAAADLAAYEAWLSSRPVWPVSAPVTRRLALYGLIPVLAWFGAAAAEQVLNGVS